MISNITEAVKSAKKNSNDAFTYLYEHTYKKAYYTALKFMKTEDLALDVVQDSYIKAFDKIATLEDESKFESWLCQIVARNALNELKKNNPLLFSETETEEGSDISDTFYDDRIETQPELKMDKEETSRLVQEMMADLSEEQRICITMFYADDLSVKEIAESLNVSENTVKSRLNYGRKNIKEKVLELEKKGTKLYGIVPFVFFLMLFKNEAAACEYVVPKMTFSASAGASVNTAHISSFGAKFAASSTAVKTAAVIGSVAILGGTGVGIYNHTQKEQLPASYIELDNALYIDFYDTGVPVLIMDGLKTFTGSDGAEYKAYEIDTIYEDGEITPYLCSYNAADISNEHLYVKVFEDELYYVGYANGLSSYGKIDHNNNFINGNNIRELDYIMSELKSSNYDFNSWVDLIALSSDDLKTARSEYKSHNDEWIDKIQATASNINYTAGEPELPDYSNVYDYGDSEGGTFSTFQVDEEYLDEQKQKLDEEEQKRLDELYGNGELDITIDTGN